MCFPKKKRNSCSPRIYNAVYILSYVYVSLYDGTVRNLTRILLRLNNDKSGSKHTSDNCIARQQQLPVKVHSTRLCDVK